MALGKIIEKETLNGFLNEKEELKGSVECGIVNIQPRTQEKIADPMIVEQEITYDKGYTGLSKVIINPVTNEIDANIIPEHIKEGVEILGVVGNYEQGYLLEVQDTTLVFTKKANVIESELVL